MVKIKNISETTQHFTSYPVWPADEVREFSDIEALVLLRSPFLQEVTDDKPRSSKAFKAVEKEDKD